MMGTSQLFLIFALVVLSFGQTHLGDTEIKFDTVVLTHIRTFVPRNNSLPSPLP